MATKTLNIALDDFTQKIDSAVKKNFEQKQYFLLLLKRRREWKELFDSGNEIGRKLGITSEKQVDEILSEYKRDKQTKSRS